MKQINAAMQKRLFAGEINVEFDKKKDSVEELNLILNTMNDKFSGVAKRYLYKNGISMATYNNPSVPSFPLSSFFTDQKIIGYAAPFDLFGGRIKKGYVFHFENDYWFCKEISYGFNFPKEWVEKDWQPVFEEEKILLGEYEVEFKNMYVNIDRTSYTTQDLQHIKSVFNHCKITSIRWHNADITLETINKIIERLKK